MSEFKNTPASMRYLGARLKPFRRPMFWGSLGLASLIGIALYQYWRHPDWLNGNLSEININSNSSTSKLSNLANQEQISAEDLAIGAELDNLDLLLTELEQNQTLPLGKVINPKKSSKSSQLNNKNTIYHRFQEKQKSKLNRSPQSLIPTKNSSNNLVKSPTRNIFKLPNFKGYNSTISPPTTPQNQTPSSPDLIPNPVGRLYLSDRDRLNNKFQPNIPSSSFNSFSPLNPTANTTETTDSNLSNQDNSNLPNAEIRVNTDTANNSLTPSPIPYNNNIQATPVTPRPAYGQPVYQQPTNLGVNPGVAGNQTINVPQTRFQPSNLTNQEQTQRYYQIPATSYQLQPPIYNQPNINNSFNSQPNTFSSNESFTNNQFNND